MVLCEWVKVINLHVAVLERIVQVIFFGVEVLTTHVSIIKTNHIVKVVKRTVYGQYSTVTRKKEA